MDELAGLATPAEIGDAEAKGINLHEYGDARKAGVSHEEVLHAATFLDLHGYVAAHRLSTIRNASRIVVMQDGRIAEIGTHEELTVRRGVYSGLQAAQLA
jgi:hypothetical protein